MDLTSGVVKGAAAPAGTPPEVVEYLSSTLKRVCDNKDFKKMMAQTGQPISHNLQQSWRLENKNRSKRFKTMNHLKVVLTETC